MKFPDIRIQEEDAALSGWLEQQLLSDRLPDVIVQLDGLLGDAKVSPSLADVLGEQQSQVLQSGLAALPRPSLHALLTHPRLLYDLQELVLIEGGDHWQQQLKPVNEQQWQDIRAAIEPAGNTKPDDDSEAGSRRKWLYVVAAIALALLVAFFPREKGPTWGFDKPGTLTQDIPEAEMLNLLSDAANAWFNKVPNDSASLRKRLVEFDHGCKTLLSAELPQLSAQTRETVFTACRNCRREIASHLAALQEGDDYETVREAANQSVRNLAAAMQQV